MSDETTDTKPDTSEATTTPGTPSTIPAPTSAPVVHPLDPALETSAEVISFLRAIRVDVDELKAGAWRLHALLDQDVAGQLGALHATVDEHTSHINDMGAALEEIAARVTRPPNRGEVARRLPSATVATDPIGRTTELLVDPTKPGLQTVTLPGGQEVDINVRRPQQSGVRRDGVRESGKVRRG